MDKKEIKEWLDKLVKAKKVINENQFFDKDYLYSKPNICNSEHIQMASGGWIAQIANILGLKCDAEPFECDGDTATTCSFIYKGITFFALEGLVENDAD